MMTLKAKNVCHVFEEYIVTWFGGSIETHFIIRHLIAFFTAFIVATSKETKIHSLNHVEIVLTSTLKLQFMNQVWSIPKCESTI